MFQFAYTTRMRRSPYYAATVAAGATHFTPYNQMLMAAGYGDPVAEYWRLINGVSQWDVAAQRQVQLIGKDAARLAQILTPRNLADCPIGHGKYAALCNHAGTIINDPIILKVEQDRFWLSIADSNILFWARAIAAERALKVEVTEPDVSPLAVQGPKAETVIASIFGDWIRELKYFHFRRADIQGIPLLLARSGWSKQGGFELYLMDGTKASALWDLVAEAGRAWDIGPGYPNYVERVESGLLSWGGDTDDRTNPFEIRMQKYVDLQVPDEVIGITALREIHKHGIARRQFGLLLKDEKPMEPHLQWYEVHANGRKVGNMTNGVWSPRRERNLGFALLTREISPGDSVEVEKNNARIPAEVTELPFC